MERRSQMFGVWSAPIFALLTVVGWMGFSQGFHIAPASLTAKETAEFFSRHQNGILFGCMLFAVACCFLAVWTAQLGIMLWRVEGRSPIFAITQVLMGEAIVLVVVLNCSFWMAAAYRPDSILPDIVQATNDAAWLGFLAVGWPLLTLQMVSTAVVGLSDRRTQPLFPARVCKASIAGSVVVVLAGGCAFTKTGPLAYDGVLGYFVPMAIWGSWLLAHAWFMGRELQRSAAVDTGDERAARSATRPADRQALSV